MVNVKKEMVNVIYVCLVNVCLILAYLYNNNIGVYYLAFALSNCVVVMLYYLQNNIGNPVRKWIRYVCMFALFTLFMFIPFSDAHLSIVYTIVSILANIIIMNALIAIMNEFYSE